MTRLRSFELVKWAGLAAMLVDHAALYVAGAPAAWSEFVGGFAFPLFVLAFVFATVDAADELLERIGYRMAAWGMVAQTLGLFLDRGEQFNVLGTFAFGVALFLALGRPGALFVRASVVGLVLLCSPFVEFQTPGVVLVASGLALVRLWSWPAMALFVVCLVSLIPYNSGELSPVLALLLGLGLLAWRTDVPRVRGLFYVVYALQWPVLALLSASLLDK